MSAMPSGSARYGPEEISRARAVIRLSLLCAVTWAAINCGAGWWLHNPRPEGVAIAGFVMAGAWVWALHRISGGRMASATAAYTISGLVLLAVMGLFVPEFALLFTLATFIFLAFGVSHSSGRSSTGVVALTIGVALILLVLSLALRWRGGVPDSISRWVNLAGLLMVLSVDATMFIMLRRTLEARGQRLVAAEREAAEMQRRIAQQERLESIGKLAGGVAHDFNNILAVILNYAAFVADGVSDRPEVLNDIEEVQRAAQRAAALTRQLLIFGRRGLVHGDVIDINRVIEDTRTLLHSAVGEHVALSAKLAPGVHRIRLDKGHIEQILLNLAVNARDAMPDGGSLLIETSQREFDNEESNAITPKPGRYVCLSVSDTGTGFTDEARKHVFEPFFTTKPAGRGTGLGLATIYGIVTDAGGDIRLYTERGVGTTVRVYLPEVTGEATVATAGPAASPVTLEGAGRTVLLVEDEPQLRQITARTLERQGYRVRAVENGQEAVAVLEGDTPVALLLTDVVMPGMSGLQLARRAADLRPHLRLLFMSGFPRDLWEQGEIGCDLAIIEKPFDAEQLLRTVAVVLNPDNEEAASA
jgi:signal transduction histidine kinase